MSLEQLQARVSILGRDTVPTYEKAGFGIGRSIAYLRDKSEHSNCIKAIIIIVAVAITYLTSGIAAVVIVPLAVEWKRQDDHKNLEALWQRCDIVAVQEYNTLVYDANLLVYDANLRIAEIEAKQLDGKQSEVDEADEADEGEGTEEVSEVDETGEADEADEAGEGEETDEKEEEETVPVSYSSLD